MGLKVWYPLISDMHNQGLEDADLTISTLPSFGPGKIGNALIGGGSSTWTAAQTNNILNNNTISICFWIYIDAPEGDTTAAKKPMIFGNDGMGHRKYSLFQYPSVNDFHWSWNTSANSTYYGSVAYGALPSYKWTHVAITYDNPSVKVYFNGELKATSSIAMNWNSFADETQVFRECQYRRLNDFRVYSNCLSPREVKELSKGLVLHYPLSREGFGGDNLLSRYVVPGQNGPTSTATGGRTNWLGDYKIKIPATENVDTYFRLFTTKQLTANATYTISCQVDGLLDGSYYNFPLFAQNNTGMGVLQLNHNGLCSLTFTMTYGTQATATGANGETVYICFMDDSTRSLASGQGAITLSNFKLEEGSIATPWIPNSDDPLYSAMGLNSNIEYDVSGFCNNGTKIGTLLYSADTPKYWTSTHISATNQKIHISNFPTSGFGNSYSFAWWGKRSSNSPMFWGFSDGVRLNGMYLGTLWNTGDSSDNPLYNIGTTTQVTAPSVNVWHHYVMTGNGTKCYVYLDGELWAEAKTYKSISGTSIYINGWDSNTNYCSNDTSISDFRIYATALSADDIKELYDTPISLASNGTLMTHGEYTEV